MVEVYTILLPFCNIFLDARKVAETGTFTINERTIKVRWKLQDRVFVQVNDWTLEESPNRLKVFFANKTRGGPIEDFTQIGEFFIIQFKNEAGNVNL